MLRRRLQNLGIAWLGVTLPSLIAYCAMAAIIAQQAMPAAPLGSPNPQKAPLWLTLGPAGLLVYADPWWAGAFLPLFTSLLAPALVFVVAVPFVWPIGSSGRPMRLLRLLSVALLFGFVLAAPWIDGVVCLLSRT